MKTIQINDELHLEVSKITNHRILKVEYPTITQFANNALKEKLEREKEKYEKADAQLLENFEYNKLLAYQDKKVKDQKYEDFKKEIIEALKKEFTLIPKEQADVDNQNN